MMEIDRRAGYSWAILNKLFEEADITEKLKRLYVEPGTPDIEALDKAIAKHNADIPRGQAAMTTPTRQQRERIDSISHRHGPDRASLEIVRICLADYRSQHPDDTRSDEEIVAEIVEQVRAMARGAGK